MSWNPFKKKEPEQPSAPVDDVTEPARVPAATASLDDGNGDDATDPLGAAPRIEERVSLLRRNNGIRLEQVEVWGHGGLSDTFMRLIVEEPGPRAAAIRELLLNAPEHVTGFRDLLVNPAAGLAAALELPDTSLSTACLGDGPPELVPRLSSLVTGIAGLARLLGAATRLGLDWPTPTAGQIGVMYEGPAVPAGLRRYRLVFAGWDTLNGAQGDPAALVALMASTLMLLREQAEHAGFDFAVKQFDALAGLLSDLEQRARISYDELADELAALKPRHTLGSCTDTGQVRTNNQDAGLLFNLDQSSLAGKRLLLAAVADGMGGHKGGEVAATLALDLLRQQLGQSLLAPRSKLIEAHQLKPHLETIIPAIDRALGERAQLEPDLTGMGTTLVGLAQLRAQSTQPAAGGAECSVVFHVGDSRAYLLMPSGPRRLTSDHSFVQELLDSGEISEFEAFNHPRKNVITRCLGGGNSSSEPEIHEFTPGLGEIVLLCSDGLTDMLHDHDIWRVVGETGGEDLDAIACALVAAANEAGGKDNITVVLVGCGL
ncbi:serine/threonine-protein phosphatase [bacterium]|nr:serine/threonine-protein phosphatase [bacterium]